VSNETLGNLCLVGVVGMIVVGAAYALRVSFGIFTSGGIKGIYTGFPGVAADDMLKKCFEEVASRSGFSHGEVLIKGMTAEERRICVKFFWVLHQQSCCGIAFPGESPAQAYYPSCVTCDPSQRQNVKSSFENKNESYI